MPTTLILPPPRIFRPSYDPALSCMFDGLFACCWLLGGNFFPYPLQIYHAYHIVLDFLFFIGEKSGTRCICMYIVHTIYGRLR